MTTRNPEAGLARFISLPVIMACFCLAFGSCLIVNVNLAGDGTWYWYAKAYQHGEKLYSTLGFSQQPLYVILKAWEMRLCGGSWIASKILAFATLSLFVIGSYRLADRSSYSGLGKAILITAFFFIGIHFEAYRFDDYHALADAFILWICGLLLEVPQASPTVLLRRVIGLGLLSGFVMVCRLNDGTMILIAVFIVLYVAVPDHRWRHLGLFMAGVTGAVLTILCLINDSLKAWWHYSIAGGASAKGGLAQFLVYALMLPVHAAGELISPSTMLALLQIFASQLLIFYLWKAQSIRNIWKLVLWLTIISGLAVLPFHMYRDPVIALSSVTIVAVIVLFILHVVGSVRNGVIAITKPEQLVLLIPIVLWVSGAVSSGGWHFGLYFPFALMLLLGLIIFEKSDKVQAIRIPIFSTLAFVATFGILYRYYNPCSWQSYRSAPLFQRRILVRNQTAGFEYIDQNMFSFFSNITTIIQKRGSGEILSLPMPYLNYFTGIAPWSGYVQTFFDTSSESRISSLMHDLEAAPPRWILYQRQIDNLVGHEKTFNAGRPLLHRKLDEMIVGKLQSRTWTMEGQWIYGPGSVWILIRTG